MFPLSRALRSSLSVPPSPSLFLSLSLSVRHEQSLCPISNSISWLFHPPSRCPAEHPSLRRDASRATLFRCYRFHLYQSADRGGPRATPIRLGAIDTERASDEIDLRNAVTVTGAHCSAGEEGTDFVRLYFRSEKSARSIQSDLLTVRFLKFRSDKLRRFLFACLAFFKSRVCVRLYF